MWTGRAWRCRWRGASSRSRRTLAVTVPLLFRGIAAFPLNVVPGRMVEAQREQVAALLGVLSALRRVLRLPAAEGMRPSVPAVPGARALAPFGRRVGPRPMMVLRNVLAAEGRRAVAVLEQFAIDAQGAEAQQRQAQAGHGSCSPAASRPASGWNVPIWPRSPLRAISRRPRCAATRPSMNWPWPARSSSVSGPVTGCRSDRRSGRVVIDLVSPRDVRARPDDGFRADARIGIASVGNAVPVPVGAQFRRGAGRAVFVRDAGTARACRPGAPSWGASSHRRRRPDAR